jgi:hypothetical protein
MNRIWMFAACGALVAASASSTVAAAPADRTTYVTFQQAVAIPGATLRPGTYIFERVTTDNSLVRVLSRDRSQVYLTQFTRTVDRPGSVSGVSISLGEAGRGEPEPVTVWYPADSTTGQEFLYR